ncbi:hypothetical protein Ocin01_07106 [Orchesella cincta]|uniref:Uncharacterized protein n=1 Tax=Orchesella cincta TaxID=48709 RepID=A0A1D2N2R3_ORCCI|nr:hypothetical protein Ocin01_07106 [Orchesella cincta]
MDNILRNVKEEVASGQVHDDAGSDSEEDEEYEDDDDEEEERKRSTIQKIQRRHIQVSPKKPPKKAKKQPTKKVKKATFRDLIPENSREFTKMYLQERAHVDRLRDDGFNNEDAETTNWWRYEEEKDPSLEDLVDNSGSKLDSQSQEAYYTYGSKRKPVPPSAPIKPDDIPEPKFPFKPTSLSTPVAPPLPKPPRAPVVAVPAQTSYDNSGGSTVGNFFRSMLGFGQASSFKKDPFFEGFKRSMPDGTPTIVTVDKTREILTTAIEIGETLRSPNQCNSLFNGCKYQYIELLHLIDDIRRSLSSKGKNDFITAEAITRFSNNFCLFPLHQEFFHGIEEYTKGTQNEGSYGYKTSLSQTSQAETLSQDYKAAASSVAAKTPTGKRKKKKNNSYRNGKMSSMSRESIEIGSDEPTMYGSGQQNYDGYHQKYGHHHHNQPSSQNNFQQNYQ